MTYILILLLLLPLASTAQTIKIGGSVYGGGNAGSMTGNTSVTVRAGDLNNVFGGARMANVGGSAFVNIDGEHASNYIVINKVYGGNDIAGTVGKGEASAKHLPLVHYIAVASGTTLTSGKTYYKSDSGADKFISDGTEVADGTNYYEQTLAGENGIDDTWDACVHISTKTTTADGKVKEADDAQKIYIGQLFGGGNGNYTYTETTGEGEEVVSYKALEGETIVAESTTALNAPELKRTYLELCGGSIVYAYGGGNNATVTDTAVICMDNPSKVVNSIKDENGKELLDTDRFKNHMGVNTVFSYPSSSAFQVGRFFGGNNKAPMAIMPKWNLKSGSIRDLYSGGNEGKMTSPIGILLEIGATSTIKVDNVYGGCRKANVEPMKAGTNTLMDHVSNPVGYHFPKDLAARVLVRGGDINNVYGGNDVSGKVYFGNAVGIYTSIRGDVYGGGNGSYPYTDNSDLKDNETYGDLYYEPEEVLPTDVYNATAEKLRSVEALNAFRPNAEQVSLRVAGTAEKPTVIGGSIYVGGNSATLKRKADSTEDPMVELKIGSHVIADRVFLGNNGENMVKYDKEKKDGNNTVTTHEGVLRTFVSTNKTSNGTPFSSLNLKDSDVFAKYMEGCSLDLMPSVVFDNMDKGDPANYEAYSSYFGSFYCGGNVGSMTNSGTTTINFNHKVIIFDKLVGGCNNAIVPAQYDEDDSSIQYNARYEGGVIGTEAERGNSDDNYYTEDGTAGGDIKNRLVLNLGGLKIQPKRWKIAQDADGNYQKDTDGNYVQYINSETNQPELEWNTVDGNGDPTPPVEVASDKEGFAFDADKDLNRRFVGGDIFGGCYTSGIVNGNVVINLDGTIVDRGKKDSELAVGEVDYGVFDGVDEDDEGEAILYGNNYGDKNYTINKRRSGVILDEQGMDVLGKALNVFGGGKGKDTEVWGSATINLNAGYTFQIFGGSEEGVIGRPTGTSDEADFVYNEDDGTYSFNGKSFTYDPRYSCYVNLRGTKAGVSKQVDHSDAMAECEFMYGGGFEGPICGNAVINLGQGRIFNSFAGSCNADILGHTETYIGRQVKDDYKLAFGKYINSESTYEGGFPWIRDITYGANDLGGRILGEVSFKDRVRKTSDAYGMDVLGMVHKYNASTNPDPSVLTAGAYTEYLQGRADGIFGGCFGTYDYKSTKFSKYTDSSGEPLTGTSGKPIFFKPRLNNAFVNFRPTYYHANNVVKRVYGAGQGKSGETDRDLMQNRSYVLIDIPQIAGTSEATGTTETSGTSETTETTETTGTTGDSESYKNFNKYSTMEVFGAGAWGGVGMGVDLSGKNPDYDSASAIIDLVRGDIGAAYGASYEEGVTRRTVVNVPAAPAGSSSDTKGSTITIGSIFGGGYGTDTYLPCDAYEANVEYHSGDACLIYNPLRTENNEVIGNALQKGALYGGNNNERRTLYGKVNIDVPLRQNHYQYGMTYGYIYGAGCGGNTWSEYTEVNLDNGAVVYEVYGGGQAGKVHNAESVYKFMNMSAASVKPAAGSLYYDKYKDYTADEWADVWANAWKLGGGLDPASTSTYWESTATNLANPLVRVAEIDDRDFSDLTSADLALVQKRYNANVIINKGALVRNYAYGGGYGTDAVVAGSTYITLLGGEVWKDIYAAGTSGSVEDLHNAGDYGSENRAGFKATANAYIKGGTVRNVYGGGWRGSVGHHSGGISNVANNTSDIDGEAHVVIGDLDGTSHIDGIPSITRNVYGGGEGGAIYGDAYVTLNKGYIGYRYNGSLSDDKTTEQDERYVAELDDAAAGDKLLEKGGNVFGGGYVANSYVDRSHVTMWGGIVRGGLYGGGEIGPIGRGTVHADTLSLAKVADYIRHNHEGSAQPAAIYKGGSTEVNLYDGHVMRDVFGGGRGYDNWGGEGWMTDEEKLTMDRSSKGYVFGQTNVHIYGGEVGTETGVLQGYGNVFGGGNEGFVYSSTGKKVGSDRNDQHLTDGVPTDGGGFYYIDGDKTKSLTRDCYVEIAPKCKVTDTGGITIGSNSYEEGQYVPLEALNQLKNLNDATDAAQWAKLDTRGVVIHNALFAGGNITEGSDKLFANTVTVYGNAAASLRDVYNIDLITLGTEDMGGLYGDGNLTLVDGFRELHIDSYGTDYYCLDETMELEDYEKLTERQQAYYKLKYVTASDHLYEYYESKSLHTYTIKDEDGNVVSETPYKRGQKVTAATWETFLEAEQANWVQGRKTYQKDDQIEESEWILMDETEKAAWTLFGVTSIYAGRPMNTIQRADMCGVFGSRMVLKGAQDRVPEAVDYTNYTINRVDEVSLNKRDSQADDTGDDATHGNYFGIYNVVNYLGNLTSDVFFDDVRVTDSNIEANKADGTTTYYQWKAAKPQAKNRNNGISHNMVALASGVYLEIKREEGETTGVDDWGYITGIIELDLINVMQGMGGGYVYARNEHGTKTHHSDYGKVTILDENSTARTYRRFTYDNTLENSNQKQVIETSGNFVHNTKQIVDDCYPNSGMYNPEKVAYDDSPAHYWFIRGSIYVYDQYISAYTGSANAYAEKVEMPLTIAAAAHGRMTLREVQPNYYAYYDKNGNKLGDKTPGVNADERLIINNKTYVLNDPVSYWEYRLMSDADRSRFEKETYVVIEDCTVGGTDYAKGDVLTLNEYNTLKGTGSVPADTYTEGDETKTDGNFLYFFRPSNNISHNTGYVLTYDINNPEVWNNYYTKTNAPAQTNKLDTGLYNKGKDKNNNDITKTDYIEGPTYTPKSGNSVFGQEEIMAGNIVYGSTYSNYTTNVSGKLSDANRYRAVEAGTTLRAGNTYYNSSAGAGEFTATGSEVADGTNYYIGQATVTEKAYVVTTEYSVKDASGVEVQHLNPGTPVYQSKYTSEQWTAMTSGKSPVVEAAKVCTKLLEFSATDYVYAGQLLTTTEIDGLKTKVKEKYEYTDAEAETFLNGYLDDAYYCTKNGLYGGTYFEAGKAYRAIDTWCSMSDADRQNFVYNYDALDLLVDPTYSGRLADTYDLETLYGYKPQYDGYAPESTKTAVEAGTASAQYESSSPLSPAIYSKTQPIDYQAQCTTSITYTPAGSSTSKTIAVSATSDDWLSREEYEAIPNEKHHYSPISVTAPGDYYVVKKAFMRGDVPYTVGQIVDSDTYQSMTTQQRTNIDVVTFTDADTQKKMENGVPVIKDGEYVYESINYFYCREAYTINEKGEGQPVKAVLANANGRDSNGETVAINKNQTITSGEVPAGFIIAEGASANDQYTYKSLPNFQSGNFLIHGLSPTEVSTLYVSSESDINDLSKEKIITVIYLYEYEESDESGLNVVPVSERHVLNIHINFKSGVPEIGEIAPPTIVLPGTTLGLNIPTVTQGAYRVTESGWEIFENGSDATTHYNGQAYQNNETPVYWYQNNYYIAYYAKTRLGKTYSNSVPVSVANYHDLKKVMDDKLHHYYIDHKDVDYEPKIYINDYSSTDENGLDLFKNLIDLTHGTTVGDHAPLDLTNTSKPMRGGKYLDFFLRADQDHSGSAWTPIANNTGECFSGRLHGDGHTISGLSSSLFNHLCGDVYNLGVTGSFTGAGVAEEGEGYVENCWINTTGTPDGSVYAVFGTPTATSGTKQIVNSYYQDTKTYETTASDHGLAKPMPDKAFYNGTVAYDLNGFYLWKRYCDQTATSGEAYRYYTSGSDNSLTLQPTKYYESDAALCSSGYNSRKYVEDRFADGDFIYADGEIPGSANARLHTYVEDDKTKTAYYPIWPDDYLFFGQALNYGHMDGLNGRDKRTHQDLPSVIRKSNDRVLATNEGNRVYRAPAYFRSSKMGVAHFNPYAVFAETQKDDASVIAYKNMTAIDFTGYNDVGYGYQKGWTQWSQTSQKSQSEGKSPEAYAFFPPLLDDDGLSDFYNVDLTRNLLAYTMTGTNAATQTNGVVSAYLHDEAYAETNSKYHTVAEWDSHSDNVHGHWVQKTGDDSFTAWNDHMLVDRKDFNAPIGYTFAAGQRMWYQRHPDNYVDISWSNDATPVRSTTGWEGVSLPFKAEIVTTDVKGEITHFYGGSWTKNTTSKIGHEYWLREFKGGAVSETDSKVFEANFNYPEANSGDGTKEYTNTFLWDYYYSYNSYKDLNNDDYQEANNAYTYYKTAREHADYPRLAAATPYIIGFPGERYYEFDLSGNFEAMTAKSTHPAKLDAQTITFASKTGTTIHVSDAETTGTTEDGYTFKPSYLNSPDVEAGKHAFLLNAEGNSYEETDATSANVYAFRPYFIASASSGDKDRRYILFSQSDVAYEPFNTYEADTEGSIAVSTGSHKIVVSSTLKTEVTVSITSATGLQINTFSLKPGQTVPTYIENAGVYIVRSADGAYTKKLSVK